MTETLADDLCHLDVAARRVGLRKHAAEHLAIQRAIRILAPLAKLSDRELAILIKDADGAANHEGFERVAYAALSQALEAARE